MRFNLDEAFGIHQQTTLLRAKRSQMLAENIANADTPHYKAKDIDFEMVLDDAKRAYGSTHLAATQANHITDAGPFDYATKYRVPSQPSADGNTVDAMYEKSAFLRNAIEYQASLKFLSGRIKSLLLAIKGE